MARAVFVPSTDQHEGPADREEAKEAIAKYIKDYLDKEGRGVGWFAERIGVHRTTVSRLLHKKVLPDVATCRSIASLLGLPPEKILSAAGYLPEGEPPELEDPELGFYLSQIGNMPPKTREIVKTILREEYRQLQQARANGEEGPKERPPFARKTQ